MPVMAAISLAVQPATASHRAEAFAHAVQHCSGRPAASIFAAMSLPKPALGIATGNGSVADGWQCLPPPRPTD
ncbi:MAG TPA: hypothetical protein VFZ16_05630 [Hyphomicrobiaceae bacterium]|nr:hypothetical protein [Hyphomicrobiaceae bacterium]